MCIHSFRSEYTLYCTVCLRESLRNLLVLLFINSLFQTLTVIQQNAFGILQFQLTLYFLLFPPKTTFAPNIGTIIAREEKVAETILSSVSRRL